MTMSHSARRERMQQIINDFQAGISIRKLADKYKMTRANVYIITKQYRHNYIRATVANGISDITIADSMNMFYPQFMRLKKFVMKRKKNGRGNPKSRSISTTT